MWIPGSLIRMESIIASNPYFICLQIRSPPVRRENIAAVTGSVLMGRGVVMATWTAMTNQMRGTAVSTSDMCRGLLKN